MRWVAPFVPVPEVLDLGADADGVWLVTAPLRGASAVTDRWTADPARAVAALAAGLRRLHDRAPVDACPFTWSARDRVASARRRAATGVTDPGRWHVEHRGLSTEGALARVATPPPVDRSVVCHGDACAPNTIVGDDGTFAGIVDLGVLGVADRWADLAIATWSTVWNFGPGWETTLLEAYGIDPDPVRTDYYRLLWDLT